MSIQLGEKQCTRHSARLPWLKSGILLTSVSALAFFSSRHFLRDCDSNFNIDVLVEDVCPIGETLRPTAFINDNSTIEYFLHDPSFEDEAVRKLSGAVKIPTVVYDDMLSPDEDPGAWAEFPKFAAYLEEEFPLAHQNLVTEKVNHHGLVYYWKGSDESLKPLLLAAHQDVVPVEEVTAKDWIHPPFEGYFDGKHLWGRGSRDDKMMLVGTMHAVEHMLKEGFVPTRGVVIALGFDEESGGVQGALEISKYLEKKFGTDSFHALLDEGGGGIDFVGDTILAAPSVGEKGFLTARVSLTTPGGHSSVPPPHTNIGFVSRLISHLEDNPYPQIMDTDINPLYNYLQCVAKYSDEFDGDMKRNIFAAAYDRIAKGELLEYLDSVIGYKYLVRTSQAIDIIHGGVKDNALPEYVAFDMNHRISVESSVNETIERIMKNVGVIAEEFNLGSYFEDTEYLPKTSDGFFNITIQSFLEPASVSPVNDSAWFILAGSIKHIIEDYMYPNLTRPAVVAGALNTGNTDTTHYWNLTSHIYRFTLAMKRGTTTGGVHSVNESTSIENYKYLVAFMYEYIKNVDEYAED